MALNRVSDAAAVADCLSQIHLKNYRKISRVEMRFSQWWKFLKSTLVFTVNLINALMFELRFIARFCPNIYTRIFTEV